MSATDVQANLEEQSGSSSSQPLSQARVAADTELMATLGNETRYEILRRITQAEDHLCVCEIEAALGVSQGAVSQALARLTRAGLVEREKHGRWRYYWASERANRLLAALDELRELGAA
ncbi:MAG: ArsR/SmtB family transcription factor [Halobacteriales archaeon]